MAKTEALTVVFFLLVLLQGLLTSELRPSRNPVIVGDNITLTVLPQTNTKIGIWYINGVLALIWYEDKQTETSGFKNRAFVNTSTGTLSLNSVTIADSGVYRIESVEPSFQLNTTINVYEPVSNVTVSPNATNLVEFNDTVSLTCSASGTSLSFHWLNGSSDITVSERVQMINDNRTLIISSVLRSDIGPFYCTVSNPINNGTSLPILLNISYGPDDMRLIINGSKFTSFHTGTNITLLCSAQSSPPAEFQWVLNNVVQNRVEELELENIKESQSGNYTCWTHNTKTLRYDSMTILITITKPPGSGSVGLGISTSTLLCCLVALANQWLPLS